MIVHLRHCIHVGAFFAIQTFCMWSHINVKAVTPTMYFVTLTIYYCCVTPKGLEKLIDAAYCYITIHGLGSTLVNASVWYLGKVSSVQMQLSVVAFERLDFTNM